VIRATIRRTGPDGDKRGIAMLLALIMVVLMSTFAVEFNYSATIKNLSAYHSRDETRAHYLAKGGVRVYAMLLVFSRQLAGNPMITGMLESFGLPSLDGADMMCRSLPFLDTAMIRFLLDTGASVDDEDKKGLMGLMGFGGGGDDEETSAEPRIVRGQGEVQETSRRRRSLTDFEGDWKVDCSDEGAKIDINGFGQTNWLALPIQQHPTGQMLYGLMAPVEYDPLFEERLKMDRWELIANIKDWVDQDSQRSGLWGGDEDGLYSNYEPRYRSKNARFDTLEELRLVAGVTDEVYETFGPSLSIHTKNFKVNVNSASPAMIRALLRAFTDPTLVTDQRLDQEIVPLLIAGRTFLPGPFRNTSDFMGRVKAQGVVFLNDAAESTLKGLLTTKSKVFTLTSTGYVNDSTSTVEAVVRITRSRVRYLEWRER
jgi:general secretion pathway protein K